MRQSRDTRAADVAISHLAARQGGVVSTDQLRRAGLDDAAIHRRLRAGRLHRLHRGVYAVGHTAVGAFGRWMAAVLACGPGAVLSHREAGAAWELLPIGAGAVNVTIRSTAGRGRRSGIRIHRVMTLTPDDVTLHRGVLPITTPERTLLDLAGSVSAARLGRALEAADAQRLADHGRLGELAASSRPGAPALRRLLGEPETLTRSELERAFLVLCDRYGIPRPLVNRRVEGHEVDFLWPGERLVVETDGLRYHASRQAFERDRRRDAALTAAGYRVVRFTYRQVVEEPERTAAVLRRLLA